MSDEVHENVLRSNKGRTLKPLKGVGMFGTVNKTATNFLKLFDS